jgi:hypothetical protein
MTITNGTYTIGSGGNYATIHAFLIDIGTLDGDITGNIISDITETLQSTCVINLAGHTLTITTPAGTGRHQGYCQDSDYVINYTAIDTSYFFFNEYNCAGTIDISWTRWVMANGVTFFRPYNTGTYAVNIHHNIFDGNAGSTIVLSCPAANIICNYHTNVHFNDVTYGIDGATANCTAENNSFYDCAIAFGCNNTAGTYINNAIFGMTNRGFYQAGSAIGRHNITYDDSTDWGADFGTSDGNLINKTFSDNFVSAVSTSSDFLKVKSDAIDVKDAGSASATLSTIDIRGNTRPATKTEWDIGADEYVAAAPPATVQQIESDSTQFFFI